ncbi:MAG: transposase [Elusimicrobiota bacterium]|jgi:REP element-mobilizing transposase RayT
MARPLRIEFDGAFYHIYARGNSQQRIFLDEPDHLRFLNLLGLANLRFGFAVHAYTLMPNHYHLLLQTPLGGLSTGMRLVNGMYAQRFNQRHQRVGHLFQGRFQSILVDSNAYWMTLSRYIHQNPVRAGLVSSPWDYPWSSCRALMGLEPVPPWLVVEATMKAFGDTPLESLAAFARHIAAEDAANPFEAVVGQSFWGGEEFTSRMKRLAAGRLTEEISRSAVLRQRPTAAQVEGAVDQAIGLAHEAGKWSKRSISPRIAALLMQEVGGMKLKDIAERYGVGPFALSKALARLRKQLAKDTGIRRVVEKTTRLLAMS